VLQSLPASAQLTAARPAHTATSSTIGAAAAAAAAALIVFVGLRC